MTPTQLAKKIGEVAGIHRDTHIMLFTEIESIITEALAEEYRRGHMDSDIRNAEPIRREAKAAGYEEGKKEALYDRILIAQAEVDRHKALVYEECAKIAERFANGTTNAIAAAESRNIRDEIRLRAKDLK